MKLEKQKARQLSEESTAIERMAASLWKNPMQVYMQIGPPQVLYPNLVRLINSD